MRKPLEGNFWCLHAHVHTHTNMYTHILHPPQKITVKNKYLIFLNFPVSGILLYLHQRTMTASSLGLFQPLTGKWIINRELWDAVVWPWASCPSLGHGFLVWNWEVWYKRLDWDKGFSSVAEHLPSKHKSLGLVIDSEKTNEQTNHKEIRRLYW